MLTIKDIQEKTFQRAKQGYDMDAVDAFLDEIVAGMGALEKENASLKGKMRVLIEKVEEYRQTEDSMRLALLSAQKMGAQIETDAKARANTLVTEARSNAERVTRQAADNVANEEAKLEEARKATKKFFEHMRVVCQKQIEFYDKLSTMRLVGSDDDDIPAATVTAKPAAAPEPVKTAVAPAPQPAPAPEPAPAPAPAKQAREDEVDEAVKSIESSVAEAALEPEEKVFVDTELPEEEEEPTRRFGEEAPKKKRSFDDFSFGDDI